VIAAAEVDASRRVPVRDRRLALDRLALDPHRTLIVAAHPWDLRAAATHGLGTAYIQRAGESGPQPSDKFDLAVPDLAVPDLAVLAGRLLAR